jgi:ABC-type antimicrobial peptide transport system permease subunit
VAGIIPDLPVTTDFPFIMFISRPSLKDFMFYNIENWNTTVSNQNLFVVLPESGTKAEFEKKINAAVKPHAPKLKETSIFLQPLNDIHYNADLSNYSNRTVTKDVIWAMALIGIFLIITACINFVNLATAQAIKRSKEVGMRKVLGSSYWHLILQFLGETFLITLTATLASIILTELALPFLNKLMELEITFSILQDPILLLFLVLELIVVTLFAGLYPAFILARFKPISALKSKMSTQQVGGISLRRALVVFQFTICQILIICTLVVSQQMEYFRSKPLGFNKDAVIMLRLPIGAAEKLMAYRQELTQNQAIRDVSFALAAPTSDITSQSSFSFGNTRKNMPFSASMKYTDENYFRLFNLKILAGRTYSKNDTIREVVINETLRRKLGLKSAEDAIGKKVRLHSDVQKPIVGVVEDFHQNSLHDPIDPTIMTTFTSAYYNLAVKINPSQTEEAVKHLENVWAKAYPDDVFNYKFLDENIAEFYKKEQRQFTLFRVFSFIAIVIGCLGLYGLVAFMAAQRTKEVGIRKVLGASLLDITMLFSKEFIKLVLIAFVIAAPLAWYLMSKWLEDFTYRISLGAGAFLLAGMITTSIALLTMSVQAIRAARKNPVLALKTE